MTSFLLLISLFKLFSLSNLFEVPSLFIGVATDSEVEILEDDGDETGEVKAFLVWLLILETTLASSLLSIKDTEVLIDEGDDVLGLAEARGIELCCRLEADKALEDADIV